MPWLLALNLAWEIAQLPLYTIWHEATPLYIAYAVIHCTIGDLLVGAAALAIALIAVRAGSPERWPWRTVGLIATVLGAAYTAVSEWRNTSLAAWQYAALMPAVQVGGASIGLSPLAQWLVLPPLALYLSRRYQRKRISGQ